MTLNHPTCPRFPMHVEVYFLHRAVVSRGKTVVETLHPLLKKLERLAEKTDW